MRRLLALLLGTVMMSSVLLATDVGEAEAAVNRISGVDRFWTAIEVSRAMPASTGGVVFLANGYDFPDALAAAPVVAAERGRLLLVTGSEIPGPVADEIRRLQPREIVLVGGEPTLAPSVASQAGALASTVTRIGGVDRVETSMLLLDRMRRNAAVPPTQLWIVSGTNFPDALSAGAVAARQGHALVLTVGPTQVFEEQLAQRVGGIQSVHIAGGLPSVAQGVQDISARYVATDRIAGASRYLTSVAINTRFSPNASGAQMVFASGERFPDGLVGSVYAGRLGQPLYLVPPTCAYDDSVSRDAARMGVQHTMVIGGTPSVSTQSARLERCADVPAIQAQVIAEVNFHRGQNGLPPVTAHAGLQAMAQSWSQQMANAQSMVHSSTFCNETFAMGFRRCAENIARTGSSSPQGVMVAWMNSAGHRANILSPNLTSIGVGLVQGGDGRWYWTQNFGGY